jgi:hypothetical protein
MQTIDIETQRLRSLRALASGTLRLKWLAAGTRFEIAAHRHGLALKYGYNPAQPRVPRGNPDGGEWTDSGRDGQGTLTGSFIGLMHLAGEIPTGDSPEDPEKPEVPEKKPPTPKERTKVKKQVARWLDRISGTVEAVGAMAKLSAWLETYSPEIESYRDPPKSLEELQRAVRTPEAGYDIHHIVEQAQARADGFLRDVVDGPDNLVRIPRLKHQEINGWYQRKNDKFGGVSPRDYLSGRNWEVRRTVGLEVLRKFGVLEK